MNQPVILWFRRDLRLTDNTALYHAVQSGYPILPVFVLDPVFRTSSRTSVIRWQFLFDALRSLDKGLQRYNARLVVREGQVLEVLAKLILETGAVGLFFNKDYAPYGQKRDQNLQRELSIPIHTFDDQLIMPPQTVLKDDGKPYVVFTPFKKAWNTKSKTQIWDISLKPSHFYNIQGIEGNISRLDEANLSQSATVLPIASEEKANEFLNQFIKNDINLYAETRNYLPINPFASPRPVGTSYLSMYLRFGLISARTCYWTAREIYAQTTSDAYRTSIETWVSELTWRDFYAHILYQFPHVLDRDFVDTYQQLEWINASDDIARWKEGTTGYPIIDAPMRQLNAIGWMPNRARMIVASFLTKHLLVHWRYGDQYFMQTLLDGDTASNNGGWQWSAGTGTDAQPYFRIFNPITQSQNFANPEYLRHWVPELASVSEKHIHTPWLAPSPPKGYPLPIVEHDFARQRTLTTFKKARGEVT